MLVLDHEAVHGLATVGDLIAPLRAGFRSTPEVPDRLHYEVGGAEHSQQTLLVMPAWRPGETMGIKLVTVFPDNAARDRPTVQGSYVLFSGVTGAPVALIDARALTLLRTAAVSAVAADRMARQQVSTLVMIGTGSLAPYLIDAHLAVRDYDTVLIWGRDPKKAADLAARLQRPGVSIRSEPGLASALRTGDVVSSATLSREPLIQGALLKAGVHVDLVGGFTPAMREADDRCIARAVIATDSAAAKHECGDLADPIARGLVTADAIQTLSALLTGGDTPQSGFDLSMFKSVGTALADLTAAQWIYERARRNGVEPAGS